MGAWLAFLFSPQGRASRLDIWTKYFIPGALLLAGAGAADIYAGVDLTAQLGSAGERVFSLGTAGFLLWPSLAVQIKRAHDHGWSGWWAGLVVLAQLGSIAALLAPLLTDYRWAVVFDVIPLPVFFGVAVGLTATVYQFVYFYCLPGQNFPNRFGPDPRSVESGAPDRERVRIFD